MKDFIIKANSYLVNDTKGYYNCDYVGYQKQGNPDFLNRLKNMTKKSSELDLVEDFMAVFEKAREDLRAIIKRENLTDCVIVVAPRSKADIHYVQSQKLFKKAISCVADQLGLNNAVNVIQRTKDTKTTHSWRMGNNNGDMPYAGITKDTCQIDRSAIFNKDVILVDDIYTDNVFVAEDCIQTLLNVGAKSVILYVIAKTRS